MPECRVGNQDILNQDNGNVMDKAQKIVAQLCLAFCFLPLSFCAASLTPNTHGVLLTLALWYKPPQPSLFFLSQSLLFSQLVAEPLGEVATL